MALAAQVSARARAGEHVHVLVGVRLRRRRVGLWPLLEVTHAEPLVLPFPGLRGQDPVLLLAGPRAEMLEGAVILYGSQVRRKALVVTTDSRQALLLVEQVFLKLRKIILRLFDVVKHFLFVL